jgi:hypothetical protein
MHRLWVWWQPEHLFHPDTYNPCAACKILLCIWKYKSTKPCGCTAIRMWVYFHNIRYACLWLFFLCTWCMTDGESVCLLGHHYLLTVDRMWVPNSIVPGPCWLTAKYPLHSEQSVSVAVLFNVTILLTCATECEFPSLIRKYSFFAYYHGYIHRLWVWNNVIVAFKLIDHLHFSSVQLQVSWSL